MKERPIIFSAPMVRAILFDRKTQTRRIAKIPLDAKSAFYDDECDSHCWSMEEDGMSDPHAKMLRNPYGEFCDRLWVKETFQVSPDGPIYRATKWEHGTSDFGGDGPWKPSIFMPRWASRITLEITHVRVERLHDITEEDAMNEGATPEGWLAEPGYGPVDWFEDLWDEINGPGSWDLNPWVWVIQFKRVT